MTNSQNGWPVLQPDSARLHTWVIPVKTGTIKLRIRDGSAGFCLAHYAMFHSEEIENVVGRVLDDWGYAKRNVVGDTVPSNHSSGTAIDLNATAHVLGATNTYTDAQERNIRARLKAMHGVIRWGGDYKNRKDEMHFEIVQNIAAVEAEAKKWMSSPRGKRLLAANPGQRKIILS